MYQSYHRIIRQIRVHRLLPNTDGGIRSLPGLQVPIQSRRHGQLAVIAKCCIQFVPFHSYRLYFHSGYQGRVFNRQQVFGIRHRQLQAVPHPAERQHPVLNGFFNWYELYCLRVNRNLVKAYAGDEVSSFPVRWWKWIEDSARCCPGILVYTPINCRLPIRTLHDLVP